MLIYKLIKDDFCSWYLEMIKNSTSTYHRDVYLSTVNFKAKKRIEQNFEPILDLYLDLFKETIRTSPGSRYFVLPYGETYQINQTDKFKYGSINGNTHIFNEITDAIELTIDLYFANEFDSCLN